MPEKNKRPRSQPLYVPLPFDAFVSGILKVDPKKIGKAELRPARDLTDAKLTTTPAVGELTVRGAKAKAKPARKKTAKKGKAGRGNQAKG